MSKSYLDDKEVHSDKDVTVVNVEQQIERTHGDKLQRGLSSRHISFIVFGGGIGVGLFVGVGTALATGGPLAILLGYSITAVNVWAVIQSMAEVVAQYPEDATFPALTTRFIDPAVGFAVGWTYWYGNAISVAIEGVAIAVLIQFWTEAVNSAVWITIVLLAGLALNFLPVHYFGEAEVITASIKIITLLGLIILSLVITLGGAPDGHRRGFEYWRNPGAINEYPGITGDTGRFVAFFITLCNSAFAYSGSEVIVLTASEAGNPAKQIPRSARLFVYRLIFFYVIGTLMIGMTVPSNHPDLVSDSGNADSSPWVIAIRSAGIAGLPSVINAAIITSAWSAGNTYLYISARVLRSLALNGQAPKIFAKATKRGVPLYGVLASGLLACLGYLSVGTGGASQAFNWLVSMITLNTLLNWGVLCVVYIRFRAAMKAQGMSRSELPWQAPLQPYAAWFGAIFSFVVCIFSGFPVFLKGAWDPATFVANYISLVVFVVPYLGWKIFTRSKVVRASEADLVSNTIDPADIIDEKPAKTKFGRILNRIIA